MGEIFDLISKFGLGVALAGALTYWLGIIIKWMLGKFSQEIKDLTEIVIKLIDRINEMDRHIVDMGSVLKVKRKGKNE